MQNKTLGQVACDEYQKFNVSLYYDSLTPRHKSAWSGVAHAVKMELMANQQAKDARKDNLIRELIQTLQMAEPYATDLSLVGDGVVDRPAIGRMIKAVLGKAETVVKYPCL